MTGIEHQCKGTDRYLRGLARAARVDAAIDAGTMSEEYWRLLQEPNSDVIVARKARRMAKRAQRKQRYFEEIRYDGYEQSQLSDRRGMEGK
jgi:hypothetical protein